MAKRTVPLLAVLLLASCMMGAEAQFFQQVVGFFGPVVNPLTRILGNIVPNQQRRPPPLVEQAPDGTYITPNFEIASQPCRSMELLKPTSTQQVADIIKRIIAERASTNRPITVRVTKPYHHTWNNLPCPEPVVANGKTVQIHVTGISQVFSIDRATNRLHIGAGMQLKDLNKVLQEAGLALPVLSTPIISDVCVGGVISNEAHGSSFTGPSVFADNIVWAKWVDGLGNIKESNDISLLAGGLGLQGIITEVIVQAKPLTSVQVDVVNKLAGVESFKADIQDIKVNKRAVQIIWRPDWNRYQIGYAKDLGQRVPSNGGKFGYFRYRQVLLDLVASKTKLDQSDYKNLLADSGSKIITLLEPQFWNKDSQLPLLPPVPKNFETYIGDSNVMFSESCPYESGECAWNAVRCGLREVIIDIEKLPAFLDDFNLAISKIKGKRPLGLGFYLRFSPPTKNLLGPAFNQTAAFIDLATFHSPDIDDLPVKHQEFEEEVELLALCKYGARVHWGKSTPRMLTSDCFLRDKFPRFNDFLAARAKADPFNLFMNRLFTRIMNKEGNEFYPGCAIDRTCYCKEDIHCNKGDKSFFRCLPAATFSQFKVCRLP